MIIVNKTNPLVVEMTNFLLDKSITPPAGKSNHADNPLFYYLKS